MRGLRLLVAFRLLPLLVLTAALLGCLSRSVLGLLGGSGCCVLCLACCLSGGIACTMSSLARFFDCLPGPLSSLLSGLPSSLAHFLSALTNALSSFLDSLTSALADLLSGLAYALADLSSSLACALPHFVDGLSCATTDIFHCRACAFADVLYGFSRALYRLPSARTDVLHCCARTLAHVFYGFTSSLAYVFYGFTSSLPNIFYGGSRAGANGRDGLVSSFAHQVTGPLAHILDRGTHTPGYLFDDLWVAVYGGEYAIQDSTHVVEPHLHERLNLDAIYRELDPAQVRVDPNREFHQIEHLRMERDLRPQVV